MSNLSHEEAMERDYEEIMNDWHQDEAEKEAYAMNEEDSDTPYAEKSPKADAAVGMSYQETDQRVTALNVATAGFANQFNPTGVVAAAETFLAFLRGEEPPDIEDRTQYPFEDGDVIILGPEIFASKDGNVISWRGENYIKQDAIQRMLSTESK